MIRLSRVFAFALLAGCSSTLPEEGSTTAELYRERCGACHRLYSPSITTFETWKMLVGRMDVYLARAGKPLTGEERRVVLDYLKRHAASGG